VMSKRMHGMSDSAEFKAWSEAKQRCHNPNSEKFKWYGARGITVCEEWMDDFAAFYAHIGPKPEGYELDRKDNDRGYEPGNVRWVPKAVNVQNRRNTVRVMHEGHEMLLEDYAKAVGISYQTAWARFTKHPHLIACEPQRKAGENNSNAKLTDEQASEIRTSTEPTKVLSERYGVSRTLIQGIRRGDVRPVRTIEANRRAEAKTL